MVEDELRFSAQFPVKLQQQELKSDAQGEASFTLPPASEPSRYVLTLLANDDAAWRVKRTLEILIERGEDVDKVRRATEIAEQVVEELLLVGLEAVGHPPTFGPGKLQEPADDGPADGVAVGPDPERGRRRECGEQGGRRQIGHAERAHQRAAGGAEGIRGGLDDGGVLADEHLGRAFGQGERLPQRP